RRQIWHRFPWRRSRLSRESSAFQNDRNELAFYKTGYRKPDSGRVKSFRNPKSTIRNPPSAGLPLTSAASRPATDTQGPTAQLQKLVADVESTPRSGLCKWGFTPCQREPSGISLLQYRPSAHSARPTF